jgi:hypothetical protein
VSTYYSIVRNLVNNNNSNNINNNNSSNSIKFFFNNIPYVLFRNNIIFNITI